MFPEPSDDPWEPILKDKRRRPNLEKWIKEVRQEVAQGKTTPLDLDML